MKTKKSPKCKFCGEVGHTKFYCFKYRQEQLRNRKKKSDALKRSKALKGGKKVKVVSKSPSRQKALRMADKAFSEYIRNKYADKNGMCRCFTCGVYQPWIAMDCSHYVPRVCMWTRFDERNVRVCCKICNQYLHGNLEKFRNHLVREIGESEVEWLESKRFQDYKYTTQDLIDLADKYKEKLANLRESLENL